MIRFLVLALAMFAAQLIHAEEPPPQSTVTLPKADEAALNAVVQDLCRRRVALLGEAPTHGDGHTEAFKVALVQLLITRCHYNAVAFESGRYEFIAFDRAVRQGTAAPSMIADAVGGLWKFDREFQPLIGFLFDEAKNSRVRLAGLDAQFGGLGEAYTNDRMIPELTHSLPPEQASTCVADFTQHTNWSYPSDHPYGLAEHNRLLTCAAAMRRAVEVDPDLDPRTRFERNAMIGNIEWAIGPDLGPRTDYLAARENWLFRNFKSLAETLPRRSKIIIWGATVHLAKGRADMRSPEVPQTFGAMVHKLYGRDAFSLGFSAAGGKYRVFRKLLTIEQPPESSLETQAIGDSRASSVYLNRRALNQRGAIPGGVLEHAYHNVNWADVVDGVVIFRKEWPTHSTRQGYSLPE